MFRGQLVILQRIPLKPESKKKGKNCPVFLNSFDRCCLGKYFSPMRAGLCASSSVNCQMDQNTQPLFLLGNVLIAWHQEQHLLSPWLPAMGLGLEDGNCYVKCQNLLKFPKKFTPFSFSTPLDAAGVSLDLKVLK